MCATEAQPITAQPFCSEKRSFLQHTYRGTQHCHECPGRGEEAPVCICDAQLYRAVAGPLECDKKEALGLANLPAASGDNSRIEMKRTISPGL